MRYTLPKGLSPWPFNPIFMLVRKPIEQIEGERKELYLKNSDGSPVIIHKDGSLGLLALGYIGLLLWRKARQGELELQDGQG